MTVSISPLAAGRPNSNVVRFEGPAVGGSNVVATFAVPAGVSVLFLTGTAPGSGGGGGASPSGGGGGGGGSGSYCVKWPVFVQPGEVLTITLPPPSAGGAAGAASVGVGMLTVASSLGANTRIAPRLSSNSWALSGGGVANAGTATNGGNGASSGLLTGNAAGGTGAGAQGTAVDIAGGLGAGRHFGAAAGGAPNNGSPSVAQTVIPGFLAATTGDATNGGGGHGAPTPFSRSGVGGNGGAAGNAAFGFGGGGGGGGGGAAGGAGGRAFLEIAW